MSSLRDGARKAALAKAVELVGRVDMDQLLAEFPVAPVAPETPVCAHAISDSVECGYPVDHGIHREDHPFRAPEPVAPPADAPAIALVDGWLAEDKGREGEPAPTVPRVDLPEPTPPAEPQTPEPEANGWRRWAWVDRDGRLSIMKPNATRAEVAEVGEPDERLIRVQISEVVPEPAAPVSSDARPARTLKELNAVIAPMDASEFVVPTMKALGIKNWLEGAKAATEIKEALDALLSGGAPHGR